MFLQNTGMAASWLSVQDCFNKFHLHSLTSFNMKQCAFRKKNEKKKWGNLEHMKSSSVLITRRCHMTFRLFF